MSHIKAHYVIRELPATHSLIVYIGTRLTAGTSQIKKPEKRGGEGGSRSLTTAARHSGRNIAGRLTPIAPGREPSGY